MKLEAPTPFTCTTLASQWTFKQGDRSSSQDFLPANSPPTEVHRDLQNAGKIANPFEDLSELSVHWVGDETWTYRNKFSAPEDYWRPNISAYLKFEGLDTFATVYLNGEKVLESNNMFLEHHVNVTGKLVAVDNILEIVFESARKKGLDLVEKDNEHRFIVHQTEISRGSVRKAQYHWGWDWGPILMACGPWKPVSLEVFECRISDLMVTYNLSDDLEFAEITASVEYAGPIEDVVFTMLDKKTGEELISQTIRTDSQEKSGILKHTFQVDNIDLWWPRGYGWHTLYTLRAEANIDPRATATAQTLSKDFGLRKVELVQEPDSAGTSFYFRINDVDIFVGGSCWIPADSFLTRLTPETYRSWLKLTADGNQNMLRVWGGGIYEADAFYEAADEMGILIWQDFMFACANYPANKAYLASVEEEAMQNVRRLQHHPSIVIWAGNNEDYQIVDRYGLQYDTEDLDPESWLKTDFPARYIYEYLLPKIVKSESPGVPYHPSSPFGNGKSTTLKVDPTVGDVHQWNVWHGTMEPYQRLPELGGRFVSEFGMEAYPHVSTIERYITKEEERYPGSMAMDFRNKAIGHERRLVSYVTENFRMRHDLNGFTHLTQVMQADAMTWAYKSWLRQWGKPGERKCGGVLVWQLNDCWPTMSWSVVDYHLVPKPAYYAIKRSMEQLTVGIQRKARSWTMRPADNLWQRDTGHADMSELWKSPEFDVWVVNRYTDTSWRCSVDIDCYSIKTGEILQKKTIKDITISPNSTTEILKDEIFIEHLPQKANEPFDMAKLDSFVVHVSLRTKSGGSTVDIAWPDPIKYLNFEDRRISVRSLSGSTVIVSAEKPVKGFVFAEREGVTLSENGFDIMPKRTVLVKVTGCNASELTWTYVGYRGRGVVQDGHDELY